MKVRDLLRILAAAQDQYPHVLDFDIAMEGCDCDGYAKSVVIEEENMDVYLRRSKSE